MGADFTAYAVIGVEVTGKTNREVVVRNCDHPARALAKFCDECGKPITRSFAETLEAFGEDALKKHAFVLVGNTDDKREFLGFSARAEAEQNKDVMAISTNGLAGVPGLVDRAQDTLREYLNKIRPGFWDEVEDSFGFWAILHCSC